jgi:hypothetical protein
MPTLDRWSSRSLLVPAIALVVLACSGAVPKSPTASQVATPRPTPSAAPSTAQTGPTTSASTEPSVDASQPPDTGGGTTSGDVPDNAVFLTYRGGSPAFSIQYVEGWQVSQQPDGVVIRDKDSSESVAIGPAQTDVPAFVSSTDVPALGAQQGFKLVKQDTVKVGGTHYVHLVYHLPAPPDPVTGKRVPSTVDRYYVPGPAGLAIVSLSTPDGVDNVDAFRQMIESFKWS